MGEVIQFPSPRARAVVAAPTPRRRVPRRPLTEYERWLVMALDARNHAGHWLPFRQWIFLQDMLAAEEITERQAAHLEAMREWLPHPSRSEG
jgi:hypothetical protein